MIPADMSVEMQLGRARRCVEETRARDTVTAHGLESRERCYVTQLPPWPPEIGNVVRIKGTALSGTVIKTKGVYEARFRLLVTADAADSSAATRATRRAARLASRWYGLAELESPE